MYAFTDTIETKDQALDAIRAHKEADKLVRGRYWNDGRGCAVGCHYHSHVDNPGPGSLHEAAERVHGIPRAIAFLEDAIFEGLPQEKAFAWPERYLSAIPVGADLDMVVPQFLHWLLTDPDGIRKHADAAGLKAIDTIAALYKRRLKGDTISDDEWKEAAAEAAEAAEAAWAAEAAEAAEAAAWAAWAAEAAWAAAEFERMADKLIELLENAPVPGQPEKLAA